MKPVVLIVGRLPKVVEDIEGQLADPLLQWLGAHNRDEVERQLEAEPNIKCVAIGAGIDDCIRSDLVGVIAARRPDICIYLKDRLLRVARNGPICPSHRFNRSSS